MQAVQLHQGWDTAILIAPFFGLLALWMFGLDERVATPRERRARRRFCHTGPDGRAEFCDPDGRTVKRVRATRISARASGGKPSLPSPLKGHIAHPQVLGYLTDGRQDTITCPESPARCEFP